MRSSATGVAAAMKAGADPGSDRPRLRASPATRGVDPGNRQVSTAEVLDARLAQIARRQPGAERDHSGQTGGARERARLTSP